MPSNFSFLQLFGFCVVVFGFDACVCQGQENEKADTIQKKITEPIHRIAKAGQPAENSADKPSLDSKIDSLPAAGPDFQSASILPSATKIIPETSAALATPTLPSPFLKASASTVKPAVAVAPKRAPHPLDNAIQRAYDGLEQFRDNVTDYSAIIVKRERVNGKLLDPEFAQLKIRQPQTTPAGKVPFSIYMKFIKPKACAGRELIWIKGWNQDRMRVHEGSGIISLTTLNLDPNGMLAMQGNRYPVYEAGLENLMVKLIEKAERDRDAGDCEVIYKTGAKLNGRLCSTIEVKHPVERAPYDFHKAKIYIDEELNAPIRYSAHLWPVNGGKPKLLEEYTYLNLKLNPGFTDIDFDAKNPAYNYRGK